MTFQNSHVRFYVSLIGSGEGRHTTHLLKCVLLLSTSQTDWKQSSDILSDISFDILSDISSDISFDILSDISSDILSDISFGILSDILSDISFDILSDISSDILSGISFDILSDISSDILSDISFDIVSDMSSDILSDISFLTRHNLCTFPFWLATVPFWIFHFFLFQKLIRSGGAMVSILQKQSKTHWSHGPIRK